MGIDGCHDRHAGRELAEGVAKFSGIGLRRAHSGSLMLVLCLFRWDHVRKAGGDFPTSNGLGGMEGVGQGEADLLWRVEGFLVVLN